MSESTVATVRDSDGRLHFASRSSAFVQDGLANGDLTEVEVNQDGATDAASGDGADAGSPDGGSGDGQRDSGPADGETQSRVAKSKLGR